MLLYVWGLMHFMQIYGVHTIVISSIFENWYFISTRIILRKKINRASGISFSVKEICKILGASPLGRGAWLLENVRRYMKEFWIPAIKEQQLASFHKNYTIKKIKIESGIPTRLSWVKIFLCILLLNVLWESFKFKLPYCPNHKIENYGCSKLFYKNWN